MFCSHCPKKTLIPPLWCTCVGEPLALPLPPKLSTKNYIILQNWTLSSRPREYHFQSILNFCSDDDSNKRFSQEPIWQFLSLPTGFPRIIALIMLCTTVPKCIRHIMKIAAFFLFRLRHEEIVSWTLITSQKQKLSPFTKTSLWKLSLFVFLSKTCFTLFLKFNTLNRLWCNFCIH